ncbi:adenylate kinase [Arthrobacter sp. Soil736]|uniref:adenylate kinase n=1 Tax=Arthrobacter sp. Soil736 TaxID=1736395 RepID=UPI0006F2DB75|nr:adenylate kinase [Arthrobacter sp. Soil736]KRE45984.1 adenylate kinase [Arthrobacter sp. Soil736]
MTRLLIIGPPGSGKGTQAQRLSAHLEIVPVSTGDIFRMNVLEQTVLGTEAQRHMDNGDLVPDHLTNDMVRQRLAMPDVEDGFLLDGYPRTLAQVEALDGMLASSGLRLDAVLELSVSDEQVVQRLLARADDRSDDNEEVIRHRLDLYHEQTNAVVSEYAERGLLTTVDGLGPVNDITDRTMTALAMTSIASTR